MIKALLLDLGDTLVDSNDKLFPGVQDALNALKTLETQDHKPLVICLVSDFTMPEPRTKAAIAAAFADYLHILDGVGLRAFFEPVDERITLSTHAGVRKPAAAVFETALQRAKVEGPITDALFITEKTSHIEFCRDQLHMAVLQFGEDFKTWSAAPPLISQKISAS